MSLAKLKSQHSKALQLLQQGQSADTVATELGLPLTLVKSLAASPFATRGE